VIRRGLRARSDAQSCARQTLQEAKPKAGSLRDLVDRAADRRRESKPRSRSRVHPGIGRLFDSLVFPRLCLLGRPVVPTKINRDAGELAQTTRGPGRTEMSLMAFSRGASHRVDHPHAGLNLRRVKNPRSAAGRGSGRGCHARVRDPAFGKREGPLVRQGRARPVQRVAEHRAKGRVGA